MTSVSGHKLEGNAPRARRIAAVFVDDTFMAGNKASRAGILGVGQLWPVLSERVPLVFNYNGTPTRVLGGVGGVDDAGGEAEIFTCFALEPGERVLLLRPQRSTVNGRGDKQLRIAAAMLGAAPPHAPVWTGQVELNAHSFVDDDAKVADTFTVKLQTRLRDDKAAVAKSGTLGTP